MPYIILMTFEIDEKLQKKVRELEQKKVPTLKEIKEQNKELEEQEKEFKKQFKGKFKKK